MAGHLLATVNPEAAAAIQPAPTNPYPVRRPFVGEVLQYFARPGEGRAGRQKFPAVVMGEPADDGRIELMVLYGCDDFRDYRDVPAKSHDQPWHAWDFAPGAISDGGAIKILVEALFGKRDPVEESVYDMILDLGARQTKSESIVKHLSDTVEVQDGIIKELRNKLRKGGGHDNAEG